MEMACKRRIFQKASFPKGAFEETSSVGRGSYIR